MSGLAPQQDALGDLDGRQFELVVIGGGILGAAIARELVRRGRQILLVEQWDFGWGTTARSTRLIHGGLRYLANYDLGLVFEGLRERAWLLDTMPNLVTPLPFLLPFYATPRWQRFRLRAGLALYDLLAPRRGSIPRHRMLGGEEAGRLEPALSRERLGGAALYWDAQVELAERMVLEVLRSTAENGAELRNHVAATGLAIEDRKVAGLELTGMLSGQRAMVASRGVLNVTGPWADATLAALGIRRDPLLRLTQGVHLIYPRLAEHAVAVEHPDDGRLVFAVPWQGQTMVGTTETELADAPNEARVQPSEVAYLARAAAFCLPAAAEMPPLWATVGVRSLMRREGAASAISRRHRLVRHAEDGAAGLFTLLGGKLTAWRSIATAVADEVVGRHSGSPPRGAPTAEPSLPPPPSAEEGATAHRLWRLYGGRVGEVHRWVNQDRWWGEPLLPGHVAIRAEVAHAFHDEWARTLADAVLRRLVLGFGADLGEAAADAVGEVAAMAIGWDEERVRSERAAFDAEIAEHRLPLVSAHPQ